MQLGDKGRHAIPSVSSYEREQCMHAENAQSVLPQQLDSFDSLRQLFAPSTDHAVRDRTWGEMCWGGGGRCCYATRGADLSRSLYSLCVRCAVARAVHVAPQVHRCLVTLGPSPLLHRTYKGRRIHTRTPSSFPLNTVSLNDNSTCPPLTSRLPCRRSSCPPLPTWLQCTPLVNDGRTKRAFSTGEHKTAVTPN